MAGDVVVIDFLVRARGLAEAQAAAMVFVDDDDTVLVALEDGATRAGFHAGRLGAVIADAWNVEEVGVGIIARAHIFIPVHAPGGFIANGCQRRLAGTGEQGFLVIELEAFAEVSLCRAHAGLGLAILVAAAHLLPVLRCAITGGGVDLVEPHALLSLAGGPVGLAGHGAGLAADALVEVDDHCDLALAHELSVLSFPRYQVSRVSGIQSSDTAFSPARSSFEPFQTAKPICVA
jgi:hypothetical protein